MFMPLAWTSRRRYTGLRRVFVEVTPRRAKPGRGRLPSHLPFGGCPWSSPVERWVPMAAKTAARWEPKNGNGANHGFEQKLWLAADKLGNKIMEIARSNRTTTG